jgi:hypothetical protein
MKTRTHSQNQTLSRSLVAVIDRELTLSKWLQCLIYVALIAFSNLYLGLFTRAHAGDLAPLTSVTIDPNAKLKDIMKHVGDDFKAIGKTFSDATQADANAARATELADLFTLALQRTPDTIAKMPAGDQVAATQSYQNQLKAMIVLCQKLTVAFQAKHLVSASSNDTDSATSLLMQMKDGKEKGHDDFKPDDSN